MSLLGRFSHSPGVMGEHTFGHWFKSNFLKLLWDVKVDNAFIFYLL